MANVSPDVAMRVAVGEAAAAKVPDKAGVVPGGHVPKEVADIRAQIEKKKGESPAATLSESLTARDRSLPESRSNVVINRNIGADRIDPKTGTKTRLPAENDRLRAAIESDQTIIDVLRGKKITDAEWKGTGTIKRYSELKKTLDQIIDDTEWSYLPPDKRIELYNSILADPEFLASIREKYADAIDITVEGEDIAEAQRKEEAARAKLEAVKVRQTDTGKSLTDLDTRLKELSTGSTHRDYVELTTLRGRDFDKELRDAKTAVDDAKGEYDSYISMRNRGKAPAGGADIDDLIRQARKDKNDAQAEYDRIFGEKTKLERYEAELASLPDKIKQARQEKANIDAEYIEAKGDHDAASLELTEARSRRADAEDAFVQKLRSVIRDGVGARIDENRVKAQEASEAVIEKRKKDATSAADKAVYDWLESRLFMPNPNRGRFRNKSINVPNKTEIKSLYGSLMSMRGGGPDALLTRALGEIRVPVDPKNPTGPQRVLTSDERDMITGNKELVSKYTGDFAEQVMKMHFNIGGKMTAQDAAFISTKPWGVGLIEKALQSSGVKEWEAKLEAAGKLDKDKKLRGLIFSKKGLAAGGIIALILGLAMSGALPAGIIPAAGGLALDSARGGADNIGKLFES